jgi:type II secretory pathway component PulK
MRDIRSRKDRGVALIIVLFLSAILTLMMYAFLREMQVEYSLAASLVAEKQAGQLAWSAIEKAMVTAQADTAAFAGAQSPWYNNPDEWYEVELSDPDGSPVGVFTCIRANASGETAPLFGLMDEAAKINLNAAPRDVLMKLPRMTDEIADAIVDWRDADENVTGQGGESAYYQALQPGYACKNAAFDTVEELLLVKGLTPEILYGEDANQNGVLDPAEDDSDRNPPADNMDGILDAGLIAYVTVWSTDRNVRADGSARVNINPASAQELRDALGDVLSQQQLSNIPLRRAAVALALQSPGFRSGADLMSVQGVSTQGIPPEQYRAIADRVKTVDAETVPGLINVNTAPPVILAMLPGWTADDAAAVDAYRTQPGQDLSNIGWLTGVLPASKVQSAAPWLTVRSYQFRIDAIGRAGPRSDLEAAEIVSAAPRQGAVPPARVMKRFAAVFDKAVTPPRLVYFKDVSRLGQPYAIEESSP